MDSANTFVGGSCTSSPCPEARTQFLLVCPWCLFFFFFFLSSCPSAGAQSKRVCHQVSLSMGLLRGMSETPSGVTISTGFHSQRLWRLLFLSLEPLAGEPIWGLDPSILWGYLCSQDITPNSQLPHAVVEPAVSHLCPSYWSQSGLSCMSSVVGFCSARPQATLSGSSVVVILMWS